MKKFKKVVPALCALLVSAVMLGSSTYAWFSMNTQVKATGMEIKAESKSQFLQIRAGEDAFSDTEAQIDATAKNKSKSVRPTSAVKALSENGDSVTELDTTVAAKDIKWVEAFSNNPNASDKNGKYTDVTEKITGSDTTNNVYALINTFKVRMNPTAGVTEGKNMSVTSVTIQSSNNTANDVMKKAVRVLFVCGDKWSVWTADGAKVSSNTNILADKVTTDATTISVYIYFDGEDSLTTTNNAATLSTDGYKVEFVLGVA